MNKLIFDLVQKAEEYSFIEYSKKLTGNSRETIMLERFAELIVQECLACCDDVAREYDDQEVYAGWIAAAIKEKFEING